MDIEDHNRAKQTRQEIEELWKAAFENNPTMYFIVDEAGGIASVNLFGAEQLGFTVSQLVGQPVLNLFYEPDRQSIQRHANACFEQPGRMRRWEARKIRKDGTTLWVRETGNAVFLKKRLVLLVVCEDITEQKRAEEALRRSERELRGLVEALPIMVFCAAPDGSTEFMSQRGQDYLGLPLEGITHGGWKTTVHPDDLGTHVKKWNASLAGGQPFENEVRHRSAAGEYRWFLVRAAPLLDEQGNILKWYGVLTDIEDRKRAEALLTGEKRILEMVAKGDSLSQILDSLCRLVEEQASGVLASILLVDGDRLRHGSAPSLPKAYTEAIDGALYGPSAGSCGTAAYRGEQVIVEDIATDPLWADYRQLALSYSLRACWSTPIFSSQRKVIATFGMYYREPRSLAPHDQEIIEQITHLAGVAIERKLTQDALRRSESYLVEAQKVARTGSWAWDAARGEMIHFSEELLRIFAIDPRGGPPTSGELAQRVHPEDRYRLTEISLETDREKGEHTVDYRILLPDGAVKYVRSIRHPILNDSGEIVELLGTTIDVTEQKRAEEELRGAETRFRTYVDHATDALFVRDEQGKVVDMNRRACESLGYTREELLGTLPALLDPSIDETSIRRVKQQLEAGEVVTFESINRRKDGTAFPVEVRISPFLNGGHMFRLSLSRDISERKRAEREREILRNLEADLARINRVSMMGEFSASLAHDIKQPIAAAVSNAEACLQWLTRDPPDLAEMREAATEMVRESRRAADIVTRTRSLFKKEGIQREVMDLNEVISDTLFLIREEAARRSIPVRTELDAKLPRISGDRVQLQQVLLNLMLNGLEAMDGIPGELLIRSQPDGACWPQISVGDAGIGLPAGEEDKIFDAFYTTKLQGTGMGLAICRSVIESHGGRLWATANSGQGTTLHFTLPAVSPTEHNTL